MTKIFPFAVLLTLLPLHFNASTAQTWIKAGYWHTGSEFPIPNIDSTLFTHLVCAFAYVNASTHELFLVPSDEPYVSAFASTVKQANPSVKPLLSIWTQNENSENSSAFLTMAEKPESRKRFIESSVKVAKRYGFEGLDLSVTNLNLLNTERNTSGPSLRALFDEFRVAMDRANLILIMAGHYSPTLYSVSRYPVDSIRKNFDWVHVRSYDYHTPFTNNVTAAHTALYDPSSRVNTDYGLTEWIKSGLPANKLVLGLAYHGYAWTLVDPTDDHIGSPAKGRAITPDGSVSYEYIRKYLRSYGIDPVYNSTYVVNYCKFGSFWVGFDDVEAIRAKVAYAKEKGLLGYNVWQVSNDYNWELSKVAASEEDKHGPYKRLLAIALPIVASMILVLACVIFYLRRRVIVPKVKEMMNIGKSSYHNQQVIGFVDLREATNGFSDENKLGEGGYGPVYKVYAKT